MNRVKRLPPGKWAKLRKQILVRDNHSCVLCPNWAEEVDHILALRLGGTNEESNLRSLCVACHKKKTAQDIERIRRERLIKSFQR